MTCMDKVRAALGQKMPVIMTCMDKAKAAWGQQMPDWIAALAVACDRASLRQAARRAGLSPAMISLAINKRRRNLDYAKAKAESRLMAGMVACPLLGLIERAECLRRQEADFDAANPLNIQQYKACRGGCLNYQAGKGAKNAKLED